MAFKGKHVTLDFEKLHLYQGVLRPRVAEALNNANNTIQVVASQLAPVSDEGSGGNPPGFLRDHIKKTQDATPENLRTVTESGARYAADVEFGTAEHGDAQPHMRPAFNAGKHQLIEELKSLGATRRPPLGIRTKYGS